MATSVQFLTKPSDLVLIIDDERVIQALCRDILSRQGYRVLTARTTQAGLDAIQEDPPAALLLDVMLPGQSGLEALGDLSQAAPYAPVIIMTGHSSVQSAVDALKRGAYDYLQKPFRQEELLHAVRRAYDRHRLLVENAQLIHTLQEKVSELSRMYAIAEDFTRTLEQRVEERTAALHRSQRLTAGIIDSMASGLLVTDLVGRVRMINQQGATTLRLRGEEVLGHPLMNALPESAALLAVTDGSPHRELTLTLPDGTVTPLGFTNSYLTGPNGQQEGIIVVFRDLSDIKRLQDEVARKNRLAAIGEAAAGIAHEIRNPLFGIFSVTQILAHEAHLAPEHQELLTTMLSETQRVNALIGDLLLCGRPTRLDRQLADVHHLLDEISGLQQAEVRQRQLRLIRENDPSLPAILLDGDKMKQVFLNLLKNALEATQPGGEVRITTARNTRSDGRPDSWIQVIFRDTGCGIPPEDLDRIFDLFYTTKAGGSGMGLAVCRRIVEDHGGRIEMTSRRGEGTAATVFLPTTGVSDGDTAHH
ncbi:MAG: ATP-binding protein [Candidatus Methylomirabilales bacterium]